MLGCQVRCKLCQVRDKHPNSYPAHQGRIKDQFEDYSHRGPGQARQCSHPTTEIITS